MKNTIETENMNVKREEKKINPEEHKEKNKMPIKRAKHTATIITR